jgi:hypothetical protein
MLISHDAATVAKAKLNQDRPSNGQGVRVMWVPDLGHGVMRRHREGRSGGTQKFTTNFMCARVELTILNLG